MIPRRTQKQVHTYQESENQKGQGSTKKWESQKWENLKGKTKKGDPQEGKIFGRGKAISTFQPQGHFPTHHPQKKIPHVI